MFLTWHEDKVVFVKKIERKKRKKEKIDAGNNGFEASNSNFKSVVTRMVKWGWGNGEKTGTFADARFNGLDDKVCVSGAPREFQPLFRSSRDRSQRCLPLY